MALHAHFTPRFDARSYPAEDDPRAKLLLSVQAEAPGDEALKIPADVVFVLDISGSMNAADRYPLLRRSLAALLAQVEPEDRVGVVVFSTQAEVISPLITGEAAKREAAQMLGRMDHSRYKFQGTNLSPGVQLALTLLGGAEPDRARRVYLLTDGELGDTDACRRLFPRLPALRIETHAYGFGANFNAAALKQLLSEQLGGSVKPICNEQDILSIFDHLAELNRRIIARDARLIVELEAEVDVGDAFSFRPQERHLGRVRGRRLVRELGSLELGRSYSLLLDLRLPPSEGGPTPVGRAWLEYTRGASPERRGAILTAARHPGGPEQSGALDPAVQDASAILDALRYRGDKDVERHATRARLELAIREKRDPGLIEALQKQLDLLDGRGASLDSADVQYLNADYSTAAGFAAR